MFSVVCHRWPLLPNSIRHVTAHHTECITRNADHIWYSSLIIIIIIIIWQTCPVFAYYGCKNKKKTSSRHSDTSLRVQEGASSHDGYPCDHLYLSSGSRHDLAPNRMWILIRGLCVCVTTVGAMLEGTVLHVWISIPLTFDFIANYFCNSNSLLGQLSFTEIFQWTGTI